MDQKANGQDKRQLQLVQVLRTPGTVNNRLELCCFSPYLRIEGHDGHCSMQLQMVNCEEQPDHRSNPLQRQHIHLPTQRRRIHPASINNSKLSCKLE